jgi:urea carboxylase
MAEYRRFLEDNAASIASFRARQRAAFAEERERWKSSGPAAEGQPAAAPGNLAATLAISGAPLDAHISGNVWKVLVEPGQKVAAEAPLLILESMKMEFTITAPAAGTIKTVLAREGLLVTAGQTLLYLES